jgi:hypothetical protein
MMELWEGELTLCPLLVVLPDNDELDSTQELVASMTAFFDGESGKLRRALPGGWFGLSIWMVADEVIVKQVQER